MALALLVAGVFSGGWHFGAQGVKIDLAAERGKWAEEKRKAAESYAAQQAAMRNLEAALQDKEQSIDDARRKTQALEADLSRSAGQLVGLRGAVATAVARAKAARCATAQPSGATGADPIELLADMFERVSARRREVAEYADRSRIAHEACVFEYNAVRELINSNDSASRQ